MVSNVHAFPVVEYDFKPSLKIVAAHIDKLGLDIRSFKVPLKRCVKQVIIPSIAKNFASGGRPAWPGYAGSTIEFHEMLNEDLGDMLIKTGALRRGMTYQNLWTITKDEAYIADLPSNIWYGKVHQGGYGGRSGQGVIPARPFVLLQVEDAKAIVDIFDKWLGERIEAAWPA